VGDARDTGGSEGRTAVDAVAAALAAIDEREEVLQAWAAVDGPGALAAAARVDALDPEARGPLHGLALGVKDVLDTADLPTCFGSPIHAGRRPGRDASVVALLRAAGAVVVGKTHTAEFAGPHPAPTTNPYDPGHTPGGSSSGSAAAVAAGMVDAALGTQTGGSIVRPAAFCGVVGYKPTFGTLSCSGVLECAASLDTVGVLASDVATAAAVVAAAAERPALAVPDPAPGAWRVGWLQPTGWERAEPAVQRAVEEAAVALADGGPMVAWDEPSWFAGALADHRVLWSVETAHAFGWERAHHWDELSAELQALISEGVAQPEKRILAAYAGRDRTAVEAARLFAEADVVVLPAALGEAPAGLGSTGDPVFAAAWTMWGFPALSVPWGLGPRGLPVGVQLVAPRGADRRLLAAGARLAELAPPTPPPPGPVPDLPPSGPQPSRR